LVGIAYVRGLYRELREMEKGGKGGSRRHLHNWPRRACVRGRLGVTGCNRHRCAEYQRRCCGSPHDSEMTNSYNCVLAPAPPKRQSVTEILELKAQITTGYQLTKLDSGGSKAGAFPELCACSREL